ncbi:hypothetical protein SCE1572_47625 [Sorangium cellulosum So0157-2]|uniref:HEAT repeat domain-containing protein n=1 Tax=Sorangium cellulosum So0157-2 TaxID=1254432 RepID=S4YF30_SORCE|nr:hypothetical protein SCE1572_47625 [Sorangium cellulosum So0157-2]
MFLLGPRTSHADFERFAKAQGWVLHEDRPSKGPKSPYEQIWVTSDQSTAIHYMDDPTPKERFLIVYGRHTGDVAFDVGANLDIETSDDVMDRAVIASTDAERVNVAWQIGVVAKAYDETALDILKSLYDGADDVVRHAVINAVGYRGWPEAMSFLEDVAKDDPSPELRENARAIVEAWREERGG